ncbi:MAG: 1-acyl-sn-glycerol-3-phosphate acyltransferase [Nitrospinaceae bacterium]|nr:MAG: 1-acyl-sn-glycerol-3-phosphate acyltransferase [Nitrospinaceae bacterium]
MGTLLAVARTAAIFLVYLGFAVIGGVLALSRFLSTKRRHQLISGFTRQWARCSCFIFNIRVRVVGALKDSPGSLIVANHIGTPDIFVLGSCFSGFFVSKAEISRWPLIRLLAHIGKTIFAERSKRHQVKEIVRQMHERLEGGSSVILFPEGGATDGQQVIDFKPSPFEAAVLAKSPVVPVTIIYHDPNKPSIACWNQIPFLEHMLRLLKNPRLDATVYLHEPIAGEADRRKLAQASCRVIREMHREKTLPGK